MNITLRKKVLLLVCVAMFAIATVLSFISVSNIQTRGKERVAGIRATLLSERKLQLQNLVDMGGRTLAKMSPDEMKKVARNMKYGESGYLWIQDFNNFMILHPDPRLDNKDGSGITDPNGVAIIKEITKLCRENGSGFLNYAWRKPGSEVKVPKISYAKTIPGTSWIVGTGVYIDDIEQQVAKEEAVIQGELKTTIGQYLAISLLLSLLLLMITVFLVSRYITGPLTAISNSIKTFDNDLTIKIPVRSHDEVGMLGAWFNEYIAKLHAVISMVSTVTEKINTNANVIASSVDQQSGFSSQLSSSVMEISSTMEEFSSTATQIAYHSQGVVERADATLEETKRGAEEVEGLSARINDIYGMITDDMNEIIDLGKKSKEINKVMELINNIANQTRLIAFNAALEAASAGESGKRFGVVAVEIRRLADSVVESTAEIERKITEIQDSVNRLVMSSEKSSLLTREGQEFAINTVTLLMENVSGVEETANAARQISLSTQQQQIASSQVVLALKDIEQGIHAATASIHDSNKVTDELASLSEQLRSLVTTFKLSPATPPQDPG